MTHREQLEAERRGHDDRHNDETDEDAARGGRSEVRVCRGQACLCHRYDGREDRHRDRTEELLDRVHEGGAIGSERVIHVSHRVGLRVCVRQAETQHEHEVEGSHPAGG